MKALALALLLAACSSTSAHTGSAWRALPESDFATMVPAVPGWSGDHEARPAPSASRTPTPTPSGPTPTHLASPTTRPCCASSTVTAKGWATFYAYHPGQAAAALRLRDALGPNWRGMTVNVCKSVSTHHCIRVTLTDFESSTIPGRLIDLDASDWAAICGDLSRGVCDVTVSR